MRLPLALMVVFIHLNFRADATSIHWLHPTAADIMPISVSVLVGEVAAIAVPLFFMVSGYLFFLNTKWSLLTFARKLRRRVRSLLVPYLLFNTLAVIGLMAATILNSDTGISEQTVAGAINRYLGNFRWLHIYWDAHITGYSTNLLGWRKSVSYPMDVPLWFIRDLMVVVLMAPLWHWLLQRMKGWGLLLLMILSLTGIWIPLAGFSVTSCFYFCIGAWAAPRTPSLLIRLPRVAPMLTAVALLLMAVDLALKGTPLTTYARFFFLLLAVIATAAWFTRLAKRPAGRFFPLLERHASPASFFVFAVHALPIAGVNIIGVSGLRPVEWVKGLIWNPAHCAWTQVGEMLLTGVITMALCVVFYFLFYFLCPSVLNFLTGRRPRV